MKHVPQLQPNRANSPARENEPMVDLLPPPPPTPPPQSVPAEHKDTTKEKKIDGNKGGVSIFSYLKIFW